MERWSIERSALSWLELRSELLELAGRTAETGGLLAHLLELGYQPRSATSS